jgi:type III restriction enzyme
MPAEDDMRRERRMKFQFDGNQSYQLRAIESVAALFHGQPRVGLDWTGAGPGELFGSVRNRLLLDESQLLANLQDVQRRNQLAVDNRLDCIEDEIPTAVGKIQARFPNYSVEMETGTGKTYVYTRTALELHRRYGLRKFIVVVPSVAIREGVLKSLKDSQEHLRAMYDNVPYRYSVYDSKSIAKVRQYTTSDSIELLVMTIDSFNKEDNVIKQSTDRLQGATPIFLVQSARPVLILDEPQNMESELRIKALASLHPLCALRYSATHRNPYNVVYRLTPFEAYRQGLVKKIEVASVMKEDDYNQVFVRLDEIRTDKKTVQAKIALHQRMANGTVKLKSYLFKPGACLQDKADRPEYSTFVIDEINPKNETVFFKNGIEIVIGHTQGADQAALFREQIRYTVEQHLRRQKSLRPLGIKVVSLFFIDRVENYTGEGVKASDEQGLYPGIIREFFDDAFDDLKEDFPEFASIKAQDARKAYFAEKRRRGGEREAIDSTGKSSEDREAFNLIMREKDRLLDFSEPVAFIFSHSALREGWDNPNVCQICTLNQTVSEVKKRQEVGRGMRLVRNQDGKRVFEDKANVLTVIANESYQQFVDTLQQEMIDEFGVAGAAPKPIDARKKKTTKRKPLEELPEDFKQLWERIKHKTRYQVTVDTLRLVRDVVAALNMVKIEPPRIVSVKADVEAVAGKDELRARQLTGVYTLAVLKPRGAVPNIVEMIEDLLAHVSPPIKLTRRTLAEILQKTSNRQSALDNPQEFTQHAARIIREKAIHQIVEGIQYTKLGTWYEMELFAEEEETASDRIVEVDKSIYDFIVCQSETERRFVEALKLRNDVRLFLKLPSWFKVPTPVGNYNPDWGLVMTEPDQFGDSENAPILYLIRETKSETDADKLRGTENQKIHCGRRHFAGALGVDFKTIKSADELP